MSGRGAGWGTRVLAHRLQGEKAEGCLDPAHEELRIDRTAREGVGLGIAGAYPAVLQDAVLAWKMLTVSHMGGVGHTTTHLSSLQSHVGASVSCGLCAI